jgi:carboxylesterase
MTEVMAGAEAFRVDSDEGARVLVLHGFTGTTQSMRYLGEQLHRRFGFAIRGPRLKGHGTSPEDMATTGYLDWVASAEEALHELSGGGARVFVTGLSMGRDLNSRPSRHPGIRQTTSPSPYREPTFCFPAIMSWPGRHRSLRRRMAP